ncbi:homeotic protein caudal-like [Condylostylus longicornis]|uniref:homeotic protein caudal-like n=1 Tax=Condylostylus longicornis TaxID=2530218 RepID=UPI00244DF23D|nr:homeotic protein caudal-like [Condylostylus longicornis]
MVSYYNSLSYPQKHHTTNLSYPTTPHQAWFPTNYHPHSAANQQFLNGMTGPPDHATHLNHAAMYYNSHMFHQGPPHSAAPPPPHDLYGARENYQNFSATGSGTSTHHLQTQLPPPPPSSTSSATSSSSSSAFHYPHHHHHHHPLHSHMNGLQSNGHHFYSSAHFGIGTPSINSIGSPLDETSSSADILTDGIPSPPNTTGSGGSGINSPGVPNSSSSPHGIINNRNTPIATSTPTNLVTNNARNNNNSKNNNNNNNNKSNNDNNNRDNDDIIDDDSINGDGDSVILASKLKNQLQQSNVGEYYDWMKKPASYGQQPNPGKTRTKDKYRVVYTDYQRLELEKEYHTSRYITIRRKTELAQCLQLSERQVKIWFQNRRAKERKQTKKSDDPEIITGNSSSSSPSAITGSNLVNGMNTNTVADDLAHFLDIKPKLENSHNDYPHNTFHPQLCSGISMGPPPPPSASSNILNHYGMIPPTSHQGHPHLGMSSSTSSIGQNGILSQPPSGQNNNVMQHAYTQMLQSMVEPIP